MKNHNNLKNTDIIDFDAFYMAQIRIRFMIFVILSIFVVIIFRILNLNFMTQEDIKNIVHPTYSAGDFTTRRNNIYDRKNRLLATNISTASLYANPKEVVETEMTAKRISQILGDEDYNNILHKISNDKKQFIWLKRHIAPAEQQLIHNLGLPGIYFAPDEKRIYPQGNMLSHVLGFVDIDGNGIAGIEKTLGHQLVSLDQNDKVVLSIDLAIQNVLYEELKKVVEMHDALGASGLITDVQTGEILAMVSIPDFDPHNIDKASERQLFNQNTLGDYEMGSTMKLITVAMGLEEKRITVDDAFDVSQPLQIGRFKIHDYRGKGGMLSVPEILIYSSNLGIAQIIEKIGYTKQQKYLRDFGILNKVDLELPEMAAPLYPNEKLWKDVSMITISYGHGLAMTPLHVAQAVGALVNGGNLVKPTLIKNKKEVRKKNIIKNETSEMMKKLMRMVVQYGSGRQAEVKGYYIGGKTGTAEKVINGKYNKSANLASFLGSFPIYNPKYAVLILVDEAKPNKINHGFTTGGMIAAPVAGKVIHRIAPMLNVLPVNDQQEKNKIDEQLMVKFTVRNKELR